MANDHIADDRKKVRLIDANEFWNRLSHVAYDIFTVHEKDGQLTGTASVGYYTETIEEVLKQTKTVDAVEVVRCKDCEHYEADRVGIPGGDPRRVYECGYCYHWKYEAGDSPNSVDADDFCSYGERRTE